MQIILLEKVMNLGDSGRRGQGEEGFARNFLIPQGKARRATDTRTIKEFEAKPRRAGESSNRDRLSAAEAVNAKLEGIERRIPAEGRRRWQAVRIGDQLRHRRSAEAGPRRR